MNSAPLNVVTNLMGRLWIATLSLLLIPFYMAVLGPEGYGLIAFFATIQVVVNLFDFGVSTTVSRVTARLSAEPNGGSEALSLVRTLELTYWAIGLVLGVVMV